MELDTAEFETEDFHDILSQGGEIPDNKQMKMIEAGLSYFN